MSRKPTLTTGSRRLRTFHVALAWVTLIAAYVALNATALPFSIPTVRAHALGRGILNTLPHYDAAQAYDHIASYTSVALRAYHLILVLDVVLLIPLYIAAFAGAILLGGERVFARKPRVARALAALPFIGGACNLVEDALVFWLLERWPIRHDTVANLAGSITLAKTLLLMLSLLCAATLWLSIAASVTAFRLGLRRCHV
jgi:hypothetical protein